MEHREGKCERCGIPFDIGCKHYRLPKSRRTPSKMELIPIEKCKEAHLEKLEYGTYPYCNKHGLCYV